MSVSSGATSPGATRRSDPRSTIAIPLHSRDGAVIAHALIDELDAALAEYNWSLHSDGYAKRRVPGGGTEYLHRRVLGLAPGDGHIVDHVDGDRLDCRRSRLRLVTKSGNAQNSTATWSASGVRGVTWHRQTGRWQAHLHIAGKHVHGGLFDSIEEAAHARAELVRQYHPFARTAAS